MAEEQEDLRDLLEIMQAFVVDEYGTHSFALSAIYPPAPTKAQF